MFQFVYLVESVNSVNVEHKNETILGHEISKASLM